MGKKLLFVLLVFGFGIVMVNSQEIYPVRGTVIVREGDAKKVNLSIYSGQKEIRVPVDIKGDFVTSLHWDKDYMLHFSKPGYVSKRINFSTRVPNNVNKSLIYPYEILVELFPTFPNIDTVFFKNPVAKILYSPIKNDFDYDLDYLLVVKEKIKQVKKEYSSWKRQLSIKKTVSKEVIAKQQAKSVVRYQKSVETDREKTTLPVSAKVSRIVQKNKVKENPFGLPPIKDSYPEGKTVEVHQLKGKVITRVIIKNLDYQKVFYKVKHDWGGLYYFVEETPSYYRSISKYNFEKATKN